MGRVVNLKSAFAKLKADQAGVDNLSRDLIKKFALDVYRELILTTPVDTGLARGNWDIGFDQEPTDLYPEDPSGSAATNRGETAILTYNGDPYVKIYIVNNLPYIERLNDGHSTKAPKMFIEQAIAKARKEFNTQVGAPTL